MFIQDQDDEQKVKEEYLHVLAENELWKSQVKNMTDLNRQNNGIASKGKFQHINYNPFVSHHTPKHEGNEVNWFSEVSPPDEDTELLMPSGTPKTQLRGPFSKNSGYRRNRPKRILPKLKEPRATRILKPEEKKSKSSRWHQIKPTFYNKSIQDPRAAISPIILDRASYLKMEKEVMKLQQARLNYLEVSVQQPAGFESLESTPTQPRERDTEQDQAVQGGRSSFKHLT